MNDKTEQPTPKKLRDARKKGQVAKSKEVSSAALITAIFAMMSAMMASIFVDVRDMLLFPTRFYEMEFEMAANIVLQETISTSLQIVTPIIATVAAVGVIANMAQVGMLFSTESLKPKMSNLSPASGIKKIFGVKNLVEFLKSAAKIAFLSLLLYLVIRGSLPDLVKLPHCGVACIPAVVGTLLSQVMIYTVAAFVIIAFADFVYQKHSFTKSMMMSKEDIKKEFKESEGDPHVKGHRKQFAQELVQGQDDAGVKNSNAVVTNPTHLAVALAYVEGETPLPIIMAMGENKRAERMVKVAEKEGIPVLQNIAVARGLFEKGNVEQYIPVDMIEPVAEVMRMVRDLEARG